MLIVHGSSRRPQATLRLRRPLGLLPQPLHPFPPSYTVALHHSLLFFNVQRYSQLSYLTDVKVWLVGGYYDTGDNAKFHFPLPFSMMPLSWSVVENSNKYNAVGEYDHIRWGTDYLFNFNSSASTITKIYSQDEAEGEAEIDGDGEGEGEVEGQGEVDGESEAGANDMEAEGEGERVQGSQEREISDQRIESGGKDAESEEEAYGQRFVKGMYLPVNLRVLKIIIMLIMTMKMRSIKQGIRARHLVRKKTMKLFVMC